MDFNTDVVCYSQNNLSSKLFDYVHLCSVIQYLVGFFCLFMFYQSYFIKMFELIRRLYEVFLLSMCMCFKIECDPSCMRKREKQNSHWLTMKCFWWYNIRMLVLSRQKLSFCHKSEGVSWWTYISFCCSVVATLCCFDLMQCWFCFTESL